ncbi:hypothetical protein MTO96_001698 [Rhipicephalus appendiculatus]
MDRYRARAAHRFSWRPHAFGQFVLPAAPPRLASTLQSNDVEMRDVESEDAVMTSMTSVNDVEMEDVSNQPVAPEYKTATPCRLCAMLAASRNATPGTNH